MRFAPTSAARTLRRLALGLALLTPPITSLGEAQAQESRGHSSSERARELFKKSEESYREGRFQESIDLLTEAYRLDPKPVLLYNIARGYEGMGDTAHAIEAYRRYLDNDPGASDRRALEQRVATLERQEQEREALERQRDAAAQAKRDARDQVAPPAPKPASPSPVPWVFAAVGAAGVGAGVVLGVIARSRHQAALDNPDAVPAVEQQSSAEHMATAANVALIAGGSLLAGGVLWGVIDVATHRRAAAPSAAVHVRLALAPSGVLAHGTF